MPLPRYNWHQTYEWNYAHAPAPAAAEVPAVGGAWMFCGRRVGSPLGVAAGPLLNGEWCLYYASLGFDVVTYKTVRSRERASYPLPNLQPVVSGAIAGGERGLPAAEEFAGSWAISFGMPSRAPEAWQVDVAETRQRLAPEKVLNVSVVGTMQPSWTVAELADDYRWCAAAAAARGADSIEINLSCPNVTTCDGQLYQQPGDSALIARRVREAIGRRPLVAKIGHFLDRGQIGPLVEAIAPQVDAIATTNCVAATVVGGDGRAYFDGQPRGIGGRAILEESLRQTEAVAECIARRGFSMRVIGVGGIATAEDVRRYLAAGAESVQIATAAMIDPGIALKIRAEL